MNNCVICEGMCCDDATAWRSTSDMFKAQAEHYRLRVVELERQLDYAREAVKNALCDLNYIQWS